LNTPLYIGIILLVGLVGGKVASKVNLPSVTGYILFGLLLGPSFTNIVTKELIYKFNFINDLALAILALSIGAELHRSVFKKYGKTLFLVSIGDELVTFSLVTLLTYLLGISLEIAVILGVLAMTVSPSGVFSIIKEYECRGIFTKNVLALVAIDNLICIILFGIVMAIIQGLEGTHMGGYALFGALLLEILMTLLFGVVSGFIVAKLMKRSTSDNKILVFLLGVLLVNTGIAIALDLSALLLNMTMGSTIVNLIDRKIRMARMLERVELPVFVLFLTLAGAKLDIGMISTVGIVGIGYIVGRLGGKVGGSFIASGFTNLEMGIRKNIGLALTPQAGVAIGLSIIAEQKIPQADGIITGVVLTGVIFFEIVGPLLLKQALKNTGEIE